MTTLVVSDLHLGARYSEVLGRPAALEALTARLQGADRLVLLGDTIELRGRPTREALAAAEPALRAIGQAIGPDGEVVLVPGNHDHALVAGWLDWRERRDVPPALELDQRIPAHHASWIAKRVAGWLAPAAVEVAYPGVWVRDDLYATHGHFMDAHAALPTFERLAAGLMARMNGSIPERAAIEDYEAVLTPLYAWLHAVAQRRRDDGRAPGATGDDTAVRAWTLLNATGSRPLSHRAAARLFPLAVVAVNRAGVGPVDADVTPEGMRRSALRAMDEVVRRLGITAPHVVFGHSHRCGPLPGDDVSEWRTPTGSQLHNCGSWVFARALIGSARPAAANPYWPGRLIAVDADGPPRIEALLDGADAQTLTAPPG